MPLKLSELLNPAPSSQRSTQTSTTSKQSPPPSHATLPSPDQLPPSPWQRSSSFSPSNNTTPVVTSAYDAAHALTALATSAAPSYNHSYAYTSTSAPQSRDQGSSFNSYSEARRASNYGSVAGPIEPSPPIDRAPSLHSPTLDQYHHGSRSPEERRQSVISRSSPPPRLAPIHTGALGDQSVDKPQRGSAYAHDSPYILPPPQHATPSSAIDQLDHFAPSREQGHARETSNTVQTGELSTSVDSELQRNAALSSSPSQPKRPADLPSPPLHIKSEFSVTGERDITPSRPSQQPPQQTPPEDGIDPETLKAIEAMKNEHGLRGSKPKPKVEPAVAEPDAAPKKRPAPKTTAATKKGVAKRAPAPKKRKVEDPTIAASPTSTVRPSPTPSKSSKPTPAAKGAKGSKSNTPALGSSPPAEEAPEDDMEDDAASQGSSDDVFCTCRKGDNHTWMIACDGGCEDWFHGKCVKIREEDGDLIDKYICPNCEAKGRGVTTWKPMCRLEGCRKPARVAKNDTSKYCSKECGEKFMRLMVEKSNSRDAERRLKAKDRRKANRVDHYENSLEGSDDEDMGPRGGALRTGELKALANSVSGLDSFRRLGDGVLTPPYTTSPTASTFPDSAKLSNGDTKLNGDIDESGEKLPLSYTLQPSETSRIQEIAEEKDALRTRKALLKDRATFVTMTKEQAVRYAERENIKPKDVCGFDSRLSWSDEEFSRWRDTKAGQTALSLQTLEPAESENGATEMDGEIEDEKPKINGENSSKPGDADNMDVDGEASGSTGSGNKKSEKDTFCAKKRCERHKQWQKVALQTVRFDEMELADQMRALEREEREIRERAMLRWRKEIGGRGEENSVEMVG